MKIVKFVFLSLLLIILLFIFSLNNIKNQKLISIESFEILEEKSNEIVLSCDFKIFNPNWFNIPTEDVIFKIYSDTIYFGSGKLNKTISLPKQDTVLISSTLNIKKNILNSIDNFEDYISLNILGSTSIPLISKKYFFNFSEKISLKKYLSVFVSEFTDYLDLQIKNVDIITNP